MPSQILLLSIRPKYAEKIFDRTKKVELRRVRPRLLNEGDLVLVYVSSPQKAVLGSFNVKKIIEKPIIQLWDEVENKAGITSEEFYDYYEGVTVGVGIFFKNIQTFIQPVKLQVLRDNLSNFRPPQSFCYLTKTQFETVNFLAQCQKKIND